MSEVFSAAYAGAYDALYGDKNYAAECDLIERVFARFAPDGVRTVLDLGSGTGGHAIPLAARGYEVVGVERSGEMLARARRKAAGKVELHQGDLRDAELGREFDAALMMFAVLGYQRENRDVLAALAAARRHVRTGGLLVFDVWYGPAVLHERPSDRVRTVELPGGRIERTASSELDIRAHVCTVTFRVRRFEGDRSAEETEERHRMRFFFPRELELFLELSGFTLVELGAFPDFERAPDESTWNVLAVARRL